MVKFTKQLWQIIIKNKKKKKIRIPKPQIYLREVSETWEVSRLSRARSVLSPCVGKALKETLNKNKKNKNKDKIRNHSSNTVPQDICQTQIGGPILYGPRGWNPEGAYHPTVNLRGMLSPCVGDVLKEILNIKNKNKDLIFFIIFWYTARTRTSAVIIRTRIKISAIHTRIKISAIHSKASEKE